MYNNGMSTLTSSTNILNSYLIFLKNLETSQKLKIISELSNSMINNEEEKKRDKKFFSLCGKLQLDQDVDEFLNDIRKARYFDADRKIDL